MKNLRFYLYLAILGLIPLLFISDCSWVDPLRDLLHPKTEREAYAREWRREVGKDHPTYLAWLAENDRALRQAPQARLPQLERIKDISAEGLPAGLAQGYRFKLARGRALEVKCEPLNEARIYGELYRIGEDRQGAYYDLLTSWKQEQSSLNYEALDAEEELVLVVQTAPAKGGHYNLLLRDYGPLQFPVEGVDNSAIQSFWGAPRDGGARKHEGNDIFAPRGTPVLATSEGRVSRVENTSRGGKVVWLEDDYRQLRLYYAHLDEQWVRPNQRVERGEALGTVGNTGNAERTPPHLHFGIYPMGEGAVDPLAFYRLAETATPTTDADLSRIGQAWQVDRRAAFYLRLAPSREADPKRQLRAEENVWILGASSGLYRIRTESGETGYFAP
ncbi:MAG: M23 family metallopeptidase [Bacteroidota bacterium]